MLDDMGMSGAAFNKLSRSRGRSSTSMRRLRISLASLRALRRRRPPTSSLQPVPPVRENIPRACKPRFVDCAAFESSAGYRLLTSRDRSISQGR